MKILIAEDEYTTRLMVQVSLENWGYTVSSVADGKDAWEALQKADAPDIAILDWEMPEIDGVEVCKRVKDLKRDNPVYIILLTGRDSQNDILQGFDAGADDYMTKPFNDDELRARVRVAERLVTIQSSLSKSIEELKDALDLVDALQSTSYVCSTCNKIADEEGNWRTLKECAEDDYDFRFTQTTCDDCKG
ncbi:MAG: DNA-binding response regulator [Desulfobulbaceae bacterium]|nr:MAG: DNA-binding response regulator [Desulfobulbaceae bacterium]